MQFFKLNAKHMYCHFLQLKARARGTSADERALQQYSGHLTDMDFEKVEKLPLPPGKDSIDVGS